MLEQQSAAGAAPPTNHYALYFRDGRLRWLSPEGDEVTARDTALVTDADVAADAGIDGAKLADGSIGPAKIANRTRRELMHWSPALGGAAAFTGGYGAHPNLPDAGGPNICRAWCILPMDLASTTITLTLVYFSNVTGNCVVETRAASMSTAAVAFNVDDSTSPTSRTLPVAATGQQYEFTWSYTDADIVAGRPFLVAFTRIADANAGELRMVSVVLDYTADS